MERSEGSKNVKAIWYDKQTQEIKTEDPLTISTAGFLGEKSKILKLPVQNKVKKNTGGSLFFTKKTTCRTKTKVPHINLCHTIN